ncbi:MAG: hypothetical protein ACLFTY_01990 [Candidatus Aenigmatarchaeota archaeon]
MKEKALILGFLAAILIFPGLVQAAVGPVAHLDEEVTAYYYHNGTPHDDQVLRSSVKHCSSYPCRYGFVDVAVSNTQDVLQDIEVNLSDTTDSNLQSVSAFKGALASPTDNWERSGMYVDTAEDSEDQHYNITNENVAPPIELEFDWNNTRGGKDLFSSTDKDSDINTMEFEGQLTNPSTSTSLDNITIMFEFNINDDTAAVEVDSDSLSCPSGWTCDTQDHEDIGQDYIVYAEGNLSTSESASIYFQGDMEEGANFDNMDVVIDKTDEEGFRAEDVNNDGTFTGRTIDSKFSRGPVRQGIDLAEGEDDQGETVWRVRGFFENLAEGLTYDVGDGWALYEVDSDNGSLKEPSVHSGGFESMIEPDDDRVYTDDNDDSTKPEWYKHESPEKPYYAAEFGWWVEWNDTNEDNYHAKTDSRLDMPLMHVVKMSEEKTLSGALNPESEGENLTVNEETVHTGSSEAKAQEVDIYSIVPGKTDAGDSPDEKDTYDSGDTFFEIDDDTFNVTHNASDGTVTDITNETTVNYEQPTSTGEDGYVHVSISDVSALPGVDDNLGPDDTVELNYEAQSNITMEEGDAFVFSGNTSYVTESGTPYTREHSTKEVTVSAKRLTGFKDLVAEDANQPNIVTGNLTVDVTDETENQTGIQNITFTDYVPLGTDFDKDDVTVEKYDGTDWDEISSSAYEINSLGPVELPDGSEAEAYEYTTDDDGWHLNNNEKVRAYYTFNITEPGSYEMPATMAGFDPATETELGTSTRGLYRLEVSAPQRDLEVDKQDIVMAERPKVGEVVEWMKPVEVYNPNNRPIDKEFEVELFEEVEDAWVIYTKDGETKTIDGSLVSGEEGKTFKWEDEIPALSSRRYEVRVLTLPVSEVNRDVEVIEELENEMVKLSMDLHLRNFADVDYDEVLLNLPVPERNMIEAVDGFGEELSYTGTEDTSSIVIEDFGAKELDTITVTYKQPYPTIIVTPEQDVYEAEGEVNVSVLVINGGDKIDDPKIETALYGPDMRTVESEIKSLDSMEPLEETELTEEYVLSTHVPSGEYLAEVRFREDFATLATGTGRFYVESGFSSSSGPVTAALIIFALLGAGYVTYKRIGSIRSER